MLYRYALPSNAKSPELESVRLALFAERTTSEYFISYKKMLEKVDPTQVFDFGHRKDVLKEIEAEIKHTICDEIWEIHCKSNVVEGF